MMVHINWRETERQSEPLMFPRGGWGPLRGECTDLSQRSERCCSDRAVHHLADAAQPSPVHANGIPLPQRGSS